MLTRHDIVNAQFQTKREILDAMCQFLQDERKKTRSEKRDDYQDGRVDGMSDMIEAILGRKEESDDENDAIVESQETQEIIGELQDFMEEQGLTLETRTMRVYEDDVAVYSNGRIRVRIDVKAIEEADK